MKTDIIPICNNIYPPTITRSIHSAMEIITADVSNHIVLKELAKSAGTNECTLKKGFKDIYRTTVYQYLLTTRMEYANHLLQTTKFKEKEIAVLCGYESLSAFITAFRKYFRFSPGQIRK